MHPKAFSFRIMKIGLVEKILCKIRKQVSYREVKAQNLFLLPLTNKNERQVMIISKGGGGEAGTTHRQESKQDRRGSRYFSSSSVVIAFFLSIPRNFCLFVDKSLTARKCERRIIT
jgi:hypothetical protein